MKLENIELCKKTGLYFDSESSNNFTVKDLKWINSGIPVYKGENNTKFYFVGIRVIKGIVYYNKITTI